jgi:hypothetical protein
MSIYSNFKPTYLYIKQHSVTGKFYLGKTVKFPETYLGSGKYWTKHINKHGKEHVITIWYCLYLDSDTCIKDALYLSKLNNITQSLNWANLIEENGLYGNPSGVNHRIGKTHSTETKQKMSNTRKGKRPTDAARSAYSVAAQKRPSNLKGMKWWNNGVINKRSISCPDVTFVPGQLR